MWVNDPTTNTYIDKHVPSLEFDLHFLKISLDRGYQKTEKENVISGDIYCNNMQDGGA